MGQRSWRPAGSQKRIRSYAGTYFWVVDLSRISEPVLNGTFLIGLSPAKNLSFPWTFSLDEKLMGQWVDVPATFTMPATAGKRAGTLQKRLLVHIAIVLPAFHLASTSSGNSHMYGGTTVFAFKLHLMSWISSLKMSNDDQFATESSSWNSCQRTEWWEGCDLHVALLFCWDSW